MTGRIIPLQGDHHRQVQALLPWYVAGRLDEADLAAVRAHLTVCAECQADLEAETRLAARMGEIEGEVAARALAAADVERAWARVLDAIEAEPPRADPIPLRPVRRFAGLRRGIADAWTKSSPWLQGALAAQAALLLVAGGFVWRSAEPARYVALGSLPASGSANALLEFRPETSEADLRQILVSAHARLVDGPTAAGAYVVRLPPAERGVALAQLKRRTEVLLAEPIDAHAGN